MIAPLDWGLGHFTRCIPIIQKLLDNNHQVITCGNKNASIIFKEHFPKIEHHIIEGYNVRYSKTKSQALSMILQSPKFFTIIKKERKIAEDLVNQLDIDIIISDNRFGFRSKKTINIFICHQIHIQGPKLLMPIFYKINTFYIKQFDHCWIPDHKGKENLSGILSANPKPSNCSFIGPLTRFTKSANSKNHKYKYLAILSGPEPQRSLMEKLVIKEFANQDSQCAIIGGKPEGNKYSKNNISYFNHLKTKEFFKAVKSSEFLITRSGYSNIMDLSVLNKKVILIPTPGQTEQEYLAKYHANSSKAKWVKQNEFQLNGSSDFQKIICNNKAENLLEKQLIKVGL